MTCRKVKDCCQAAQGRNSAPWKALDFAGCNSTTLMSRWKSSISPSRDDLRIKS
jgi:hypothetical protein